MIVYLQVSESDDVRDAVLSNGVQQTHNRCEVSLKWQIIARNMRPIYTENKIKPIQRARVQGFEVKW